MGTITPTPPWIVDPRLQVLSPDRYHAGNQPEYIRPIEGVIYHYTGPGTGPGIVRWLSARDENYLSAHFVVDRNGTTYQLVPLTDRAFHAGGPTSKFLGSSNVNGRTIGIEIVNAGPLILGPGGMYQDSAGRRFEGSMVSAGGAPRYRYTVWEAYGTRQIEAVLALTRFLVKVFPILAQEADRRLVGHEDVDPTRKQDPGPHFPWAVIRASVRNG